MSNMTQKASSDTNDKHHEKIIKSHIMAVGDSLRERNAWLVKNQNSIGMTIFLSSITAIVLTWCGYLFWGLSPWLAIPMAAFFMSLLHELEHDLIHLMYFRKKRAINNLMLWGVWAFRPSTINPFTRKRLHIHHHKFSGTASDLEERGITNGTPWGLRRLLMIGDNMLSVYLRPFETYQTVKAFIAAQGDIPKEEKKRIANENLHGYFPLGTFNYLVWHSFILYHAAILIASVFGIEVTLPVWGETVLSYATIWVVCISAPNFLRTFCLHFVSSNMHYYGDVEAGNIVQQCQVWRSPLLFPLHLFCFNFGATHAIHHFVVRDPFYIRQAIAKDCYPVMEANGVRFNDFGTFKRANRRGSYT